MLIYEAFPTLRQMLKLLFSGKCLQKKRGALKNNLAIRFEWEASE
jgi:hypothetical protein